MFNQIYLTGFKKFGTHDVNPTEQVVKHFKTKHIPNVNCAVLEVAAFEVDQYINNLSYELKNKEGKVLNIHFGVGPNKVYLLETCGYNNKNFSIPDNCGYQPINQQISKDLELQCPLKCKIDLENLKNTLSSDFPVELSTNPGRYLCNYIYFKSLCRLSNNQNVCSLFIHFPVHSITPHQKNVAFVERLLEILLLKHQ